MSNATFFDLGIAKNQEEYVLNDVPVAGRIPDWITGSYIRNGPGMFRVGQKLVNHWFDAMGCLHKFDIGDGKVSYRSRFLDCGSYRATADTGELRYSEFATDPCRSIFRKFQSYVFPSLPNMTDNPKIHVAKIGDSYRALGETPLQVEFDIDTLKKVGVTEIVPGAFAYKTTAHPHFESEHAWNVVVKFGMNSHYKIYDMATPGKAVASVPVSKPAYLHGFGMTQHYFLVAAGPLVVTPIKLLFWKRPYIENHEWLPGQGGKVYVIDKRTGKLRHCFETDPFFSFHHVNAWEEGEDIVMDMNEYPDAEIVKHYYLEEMQKPGYTIPFGKLARYRLNLSRKTYSKQVVSEACLELPRIDYNRYNTKPGYDHVYGVSLHPEHREGFYNSLVRINAANGDSAYWYEAGCYPGEPMLVTPPGGTDHEPVLVSVVLDVAKANSFLLVLDPSNMQEIGRATVPEPILYGFHGEFFGV